MLDSILHIERRKLAEMALHGPQAELWQLGRILTIWRSKFSTISLLSKELKENKVRLSVMEIAAMVKAPGEEHQTWKDIWFATDLRPSELSRLLERIQPVIPDIYE